MSSRWVTIFIVWLAMMAVLVAWAFAPVFAFDGTPTEAQYGPPYGGGPYRPDPRDWGPDERARRMPPPRRGYDVPPCILTGQCAGPGPVMPPPMPPFPGPPGRYDLYEDE